MSIKYQLNKLNTNSEGQSVWNILRCAKNLTELCEIDSSAKKANFDRILRDGEISNNELKG